MTKSNEDIAKANLARQEGAKRDPKVGEPGYVYNEDAAEIENPGPTSGPNYVEGKPVGYPQLGDRVLDKPAPETVRQPTGKEVNLGDAHGGAPLTPSEPGSAGVQKVETVDGTKAAKK